jgi:hypothetical protein
MVNEGAGYWYADIATAKIGDEYRYSVLILSQNKD